MRFRDVILPEVERGIAEAALPALAKQTTLRASDLDHASARGAAAAVLAAAFESERPFQDNR